MRKSIFLLTTLIIVGCSKNEVNPNPENSQTEIQGIVSTFVGSNIGYLDGNALNSKFNKPIGLYIDSENNVYVCDTYNNRIRKISSSGNVTTFAGISDPTINDGNLSTAGFLNPGGIAKDSQNNFFITDQTSGRIRKISNTGIVTTFAGNSIGFSDGVGINASFNYPRGICIDAFDNLYIADASNNRIRKVSPTGFVSTIAGSDQGYLDGSNSIAKFNTPQDICIDSSGNLYIADTGNHKIRMISTTGIVSTIAGIDAGFLDGNTNVAKFNFPHSLSIDNLNNLYVADSENDKIRKISNNGQVTTIAGSVLGSLDGVGSNANFNFPMGIKFKNNKLYVVDSNNNRVRIIE